jgi:hypothetical protein
VICAVVIAIWGDSKFCFGVGDIIGATSVTCVEGFSCTGKLASVAFPVNVCGSSIFRMSDQKWDGDEKVVGNADG